MLIGISGGTCSGKKSVQEYLVTNEQFEPLAIVSANSQESSQNGTNPARTFATATELLDYVTQHWQTNFVTTATDNPTTLNLLSHRPFFLHLHIEAPPQIRHTRFLSTHPNPYPQDPPTAPSPSLSTFLATHDTSFAAQALLSSHADLRYLNNNPSLTSLHTSLAALHLQDPSRLRPTWDQYFMELAALAARRSNCMRRQVGCVLVRGNRVISTGYNGTPRGITNCNEGGCPRCNGAAPKPPFSAPTQPAQSPNGSAPTPPAPTGAQAPVTAGGASLSTCLCIHAEENALLEAGRERVGDSHTAVLYCTTHPCLTCSIKIAQVGIAEVVFDQSYYMDAEAAVMLGSAGVKVRRFGGGGKRGEVVVGWEGGVGGREEEMR